MPEGHLSTADPVALGRQGLPFMTQNPKDFGHFWPKKDRGSAVYPLESAQIRRIWALKGLKQPTLCPILDPWVESFKNGHFWKQSTLPRPKGVLPKAKHPLLGRFLQSRKFSKIFKIFEKSISLASHSPRRSSALANSSQQRPFRKFSHF